MQPIGKHTILKISALGHSVKACKIKYYFIPIRIGNSSNNFAEEIERFKQILGCF